MIIFKTHPNNQEQLIGFSLSKEDIEKLTSGNPITVEGHPYLDRNSRIIIFSKDSDEETVKSLQEEGHVKDGFIMGCHK